ncbi:MAG: response regulator [Saprospiraceae bacterium]|nr:response regulator [Saprospiraceae bacterium]
MKKITFISFLTILLSLSIHGQEKTVTIHLDQFDSQQRVQLASLDGWIFQKGSDKSWSQPNIDLTGWKHLNPNQLSSEFGNKNERLEGWFRIKFRLAQDFDTISWYLDRELWLATDIYLDGALIHSFGKTGTDQSGFQHFNPSHALPVPFNLQTGREHLLAIHIANYEGPFTPRNVRSTEENLSSLINLTGPYFTELKQDYYRSSHIYSTFWVTLSTIFMILFWLMYLQNPGEKIFKLIAILSIANLFTIVGTSLPNFLELSFTQEKIRYLLTVIFGAVTNVFMLMVGEWIFKKKVSTLSKFLLILLPVSSIIASLYDFSIPFGVLNAILIGYFIYLIISNWKQATRVQWAVVIAMFLFLASISLYIVLAKISIKLFLLYGNLWLSFALFIPLFSLLIYVSLRFRETMQERINIQMEKTQQLEAINAASAKIAEMERIRDLDEIKSKFFANISHEFRTPLSLILGPLRRAEKRRNGVGNKYTLDETSYHLLNRNANRLQNLVDQLLDLSRLESGQVYLSLEQGNMIQFLRSIVFSFESMAERSGINYITNFPPEIEGVFYDKDKIEKIISNLITNAIKYTPSNGSVTICIQEKEGAILFEVTDTGKGIKNKDIKRIFERFYRVEGSEEKGSGIGLALTKELVELHNGQINVSSTIGEGTTFKVRLPFTLRGLPDNVHVLNHNGVSENHEKKSTPFIKEDAQLVREDSDNNQSINEKPLALIIEDNEDLRSYISSIVDKKYKTLLAKDGEHGERMAFEHIPDIIISDVMMPRKDGFALCNSLKNNDKTSHIPIIMLTAKAGYDNKMEGLTQGADAYLTKPFKEEELIIRMTNLVEARKKIWEQFKSLDLSLINDASLQSIDDKFLQEVINVIKNNMDNEYFSVEDIGREVGFSRSQLHRKLKAIINKSANQLIIEIRMNEAKRMLEHKTGTVSEIAFSVGYSNLPYFTKSFKKQFGVLPSKVRNL